MSGYLCMALHKDGWADSLLCSWAHEKLYLSFQKLCLDYVLPGDLNFTVV